MEMNFMSIKLIKQHTIFQIRISLIKNFNNSLNIHTQRLSSQLGIIFFNICLATLRRSSRYKYQSKFTNKFTQQI